MDDNKHKRIKIIVTLLLTIITFAIVGFSYAYFQDQIGNGASADVTVITGTTDVLTFNKGSDITIQPTQANFGSGSGNKVGSTTATATLLANNDTNSASETYNVYFEITSNSLMYTTAPTNIPELLLTITDPTGNPVTSITGLTYTTVNGISGFDITTKKGLIQIASDYTITSTGSKTDTWTITVTFINLDSDQSANSTKKFSCNVIIQKEEIPTYYWNDGFDGTYIYSYPLGEKTNSSDYWDYLDGNLASLTWTSGSPTTYQTLAQLQSNYGNFSDSPVYIKTTLEHQACLYYNNHEFCISPNYWAGTIGVNDSAAGLATKNNLQADMETALGTSANQGDCGSDGGNAWCYFGVFYCGAYSTGIVYCGSYVSNAERGVYSGGSAGCWLD